MRSGSSWSTTLLIPRIRIASPDPTIPLVSGTVTPATRPEITSITPVTGIVGATESAWIFVLSPAGAWPTTVGAIKTNAQITMPGVIKGCRIPNLDPEKQFASVGAGIHIRPLLESDLQI